MSVYLHIFPIVSHFTVTVSSIVSFHHWVFLFEILFSSMFLYLLMSLRLTVTALLGTKKSSNYRSGYQALSVVIPRSIANEIVIEIPRQTVAQLPETIELPRQWNAD